MNTDQHATATATPADAVAGYGLERSGAETRRLVAQHRIYGPLTRRLFEAAGITAGMRVLDLGSGAGDVALLLGDLVGPTGRVVGLDADPAVLDVARARADAAGHRNTIFTLTDLERPEAFLPDGDGFDAVAGRWILMHLHDPVDVVRRMADHLRPGGTVVMQESDYSSHRLTDPPTPLHEWLRQHLPAPPGPHGFEPGIGVGLHRLYTQAGLPAPQMRLEAPVGGGTDWPGYHYLAETVRSVATYLERSGVATTDLGLGTLEARLRDDVVSRDAVQLLPAVVGAWART